MTLALTLISSQLTLASPTAGRRAHDAAAVPCSPSIIRRASLPPSPAPSSSRLDTLQTPSLCCSRHPSASRAAIDATPECVASARACVRNGGRGVWRAPQKRPRPLLPPPRQPPTCCLAKNRLTCPCQAQNAKSRRRRAARARRAAPAVTRPYRRLGPSEQPSRRPPIAPVVGLDRFCIAVL